MTDLTPPECSPTALCGALEMAIKADTRQSEFGLQRMIMPRGCVAYRPTGKKTPLIFLNFCPFCGKELAQP